jgi:hypothetical protein
MAFSSETTLKQTDKTQTAARASTGGGSGGGAKNSLGELITKNGAQSV